MFRAAVPILILLFIACTDVLACDRAQQLFVRDKRTGDAVELFVPPPSILDATVILETTSDNMIASRQTPFTFDLSGYTDRTQPWTLMRLHPTNDNAPFSYHYHCHYIIGNLGGRPDGTVYDLPYRGEMHRVSQGYFGNYSHQSGTDDQYALDFAMPIGTTICAARSGIVVAVRSDSNEGGGDPKYKECANYVIVRHADGTYGEYLHLRQNGALVTVGQRVIEGQPVGSSGQTGWAKDPHLHFMVFAPVDAYHRHSLPVRFRTAQGVVDQLLEGQQY